MGYAIKNNSEKDETYNFAIFYNDFDFRIQEVCSFINILFLLNFL